MQQIKNYLSLIKFSHSIFALPFALIGFVIAAINYQFPVTLPFLSSDLILKLILIIICMISARSAAMAFNRYLDRNIDAKNPRTKIREIPAGVIKAENALFFTIISCLIFITSCYFINVMVLLLSPVALFVILFYSYTKRFTALCHLILGLGLSLAPIGSYVAVLGRFDVLPILFSCIVLFWVSGFDIIYALQDEEFDKENNLNSIPAMFGKKKALLISRILHIISASIVIYIGVAYQLNFYYWIGSLLFIGSLFYQQSIVSPTNLNRVNIAFMTTNGFASIIFAGFVITSFII